MDIANQLKETLNKHKDECVYYNNGIEQAY